MKRKYSPEMGLKTIVLINNQNQVNRINLSVTVGKHN